MPLFSRKRPGKKRKRKRNPGALTLYIRIWLSGINPTTSTSPSAFACLSAFAWP